MNSIKRITFDTTNLNGEGMISLAKLVEQSSELNALDILHNPINDMNVALYMSRTLKCHPRIKNVDMSYCNLGNNPEILSVILQSDVHRLDLSHNNIDSLGAIKIANYLESNTSMFDLDLRCNRFNDDDAVILSQAIKTNTHLYYLYLFSNNFASVGVKSLFSSVFDNMSLNAISESNHVCAIEVIYDRIFGERLSSMYTLSRTDKLLIAMHDKDYLLEYLAIVPVELMPHVLDLIQRLRPRQLKKYENRSLSMMYVAMRWWNMPSLYSYHNSCIKLNTKKRQKRMATDDLRST